MFSPLSFRLCRRLALCLALAALLATLATPLQAAPLDRSAPAGPIAALLEWVHGLLAGLGVGGGENDAEGPTAAFLPDGVCMEPNGTVIPCPEPATSESPRKVISASSELKGEPRMR